MLALLLLSILQACLMVAAQSFLKISVTIFGTFNWSWAYFKTVFTTWQFAISGVCALASMLLWMHILKHYEFGIAYPLTSLSYIIGLVSAHFIFHEAVPITRWIGVCIILIGVFFIVK